MKECKKCKLTQEKSSFYSKDSTCKECRKRMTRENYRRNKAHYQEYEKKRSNLPHRLEARRNYQKTEAGKEAHKRANKKWSAKNPIKKAAHGIVSHAINMGRLTKESCEICGKEKADAHHDDYARPLEIRWLCDTHHNEWHKINGEGKNAT